MNSRKTHNDDRQNKSMNSRKTHNDDRKKTMNSRKTHTGKRKQNNEQSQDTQWRQTTQQ